MMYKLKAEVPTRIYTLRKENIITFLLFLIGILTSSLDALDEDTLQRIFKASPFNYDLQLKFLAGASKNGEIFLCMHGMGSDSTLAEVMRTNRDIPYPMVGFNFPDYGIRYADTPRTTFGTFKEIAPALFVLKKCIVDGGIEKVHLYGFSAGGGAIINILAALNTSRFDHALQHLGIHAQEKQKILRSIEQGSVILEVPLKSFDEIADTFGDQRMRMLGARARKNGMVPIENIKGLKGLSLNIFVYFAFPDEGLGNRDDYEFIKRLQTVNRGQTIAWIGKTGGHTAYHEELWKAYKKFMY